MLAAREERLLRRGPVSKKRKSTEMQSRVYESEELSFLFLSKKSLFSVVCHGSFAISFLD